MSILYQYKISYNFHVSTDHIVDVVFYTNYSQILENFYLYHYSNFLNLLNLTIFLFYLYNCYKRFKFFINESILNNLSYVSIILNLCRPY